MTDTTWVNATDTTSLAGIHISNGSRNMIVNNTIGIETTMPLARHGISVAEVLSWLAERGYRQVSKQQGSDFVFEAAA
mgnify:CR=1 FL=1